MYQKIILLVLLFLSILAFSPKISCAQEKEGEIIIISERVGDVVDLEERDKFILFRFAKGFQSARLFKLSEGSYTWKINCLDTTTGEIVIREISPIEPEIKRLREYIDNFEQIQAGKYQIQFEQEDKLQFEEEDSLQFEKQPSILIQSKVSRERRTFFITEFGVNYRLNSPPTIKSTTIRNDNISIHTSDYNTILYATSDLGVRRNISRKYSFGASHFLGFMLRKFMINKLEYKGGLKFRIRRQLSNTASIDLSPGVLLWDTSDYYKTPGFTGSLDFKLKEWFALTLTFEYLRSQYYKNEYTSYHHFYSDIREPEDDIAVYLGIKFESETGLVMTTATTGALVFVYVFNWWLTNALGDIDISFGG